jgi:hypothetical protein
MQVRFLGFGFSTESKTLTLNDYIQYMAGKKNQAFQLGEHNRFLFFNSDHSSKYHVGLLVTVKDQRTFCELVNDKGKMLVKVNELDDDSNLMDFNFFVINKVTGLGMYQHYHQSCSMNAFGFFNYRRFAEYREATISKEVSAIPEEKRTKSKEKAVKQKHSGYLEWEILVRKEKLKDLIEELQRVKAFEYSFLSLTVDEPEFQPLKNYVRKEKTSLAFTSQSPVQSIAGAISSFVKKHSVEDGRVVGVDENGLERVLRITDNPDNFGEYPYDEVAPKINELDVNEFEKSWVVQELLDKCEAYKHIFEVKAK